MKTVGDTFLGRLWNRFKRFVGVAYSRKKTCATYKTTESDLKSQFSVQV